MLTLAQVLPHLVHQFSSEADLVRAVGELSEAFTKDRARIGDYLADRRLVAAYAAFYLTTNVPKLEGVFSWLTPDFRQEILTSWQLIDVGAGPGTFSLAWKLLGGRLAPLMWEGSPLMREQAERLLAGLTQTPARFGAVEGEAPRLLLFGHSANEMGVEEAWRFVERADPQLVMFIEPGTPEVFGLMLELRERFVRGGWHILYPCLHTAACPLAADDWCHQYLDVRHAPDVERLTQLAHKDRRRMPVVVHMYDRTAPRARPENLARIMRVHPPTKFSHEWEVCRTENGEMVHERFQLMFKHVPKEHARAVAALRAGDLFSWETERMVADTRRIKFPPEDS